MPWFIDAIKEIIQLYPINIIFENLESAIADFIMIGIISYKQSEGNIDLLIQNLFKNVNDTSILLQCNIMTLDEKLKIQGQEIIFSADLYPNASISNSTLKLSKPMHKIKQTEIVQVPAPQPNELLETQMINPQCQICLENMYQSEVLSLQGCQHIFHKECLQEYCQIQVLSQVFPINCPSNACKIELNHIELKEVLDSQSLNKYNAYSFKQLVDSHRDEYTCCPTPDCQYVFIPERAGETYFICPACQREYCLECKCEYHQNMNCGQYMASLQQNEEQQQLNNQFVNFAKGAKFKQCPNCKIWVEKNQGCNHMTCRCKYEFCYFCGGKYNSCDCVKNINW